MVKLPLKGLETQSKRNAHEIESLKNQATSVVSTREWNKPTDVLLLGRVSPLCGRQICDSVNASVMASQFTWSETMS